MQSDPERQSCSEGQRDLGSDGKHRLKTSTCFLFLKLGSVKHTCVFCLLLAKNMAFQADQKVKVEIVRCLGTEQLFRLLSDPDANVLMKTLGLLRNLLSTRPVRVQLMTRLSHSSTDDLQAFV